MHDFYKRMQTVFQQACRVWYLCPRFLQNWLRFDPACRKTVWIRW